MREAHVSASEAPATSFAAALATKSHAGPRSFGDQKGSGIGRSLRFAMSLSIPRYRSLCFLLSVLPPFSLLFESSGALRPKCKGHSLVPPLPFSPPPCRGKGCWQFRAWVLAVASVARQRVLAVEAKGAGSCERCVRITRTDESMTATLGSGLPSFKSATSLISWNAL